MSDSKQFFSSSNIGQYIVSFRKWREKDSYPLIVLGILFLILSALPLLLDMSVFGLCLGTFLSIHILVVTLIWAIAAQSWNIVSGFVGQFSFGHAAFFGLGAFTPLILAQKFAINPWIGLIIGSILATLYALFIGFLSFRYDVRGSYFTLATLAFAELLLYIFINVNSLGGASGYVKPLPSVYGTSFGLIAFQFTSRLPYYYISLAFLIIVTAVAFGIKESHFGLYLFAIRDDEDAAAAVGIPTVRFKIYGLAVSAFFTAWAGTVWSMYFTSIQPRTVFGVLVNLDILLPAVIGGLGTAVGPIIGSIALTIASELARQFIGVPELQDIIHGILLLVIILRSPGGVVSWFSYILSRFPNN
ncbi:MAG: branched-chain amino acid ABC transporter permease [Halobacteriaceae archaeon]